MTGRKDIRIEARMRNNILWHAIFDTYDSVASFCRTHNFYQGAVGSLLNLTDSPFDRKGAYRPLCRRIATAVGMTPDELFPPHLYGFEKTAVALEFAFAELPAGGNELLALASPHDPIENAIRNEAAEHIDELLASLPSREAKILELRFGLHDNDEHTRDAIAPMLGISRDRVRQLEARALQKIRDQRPPWLENLNDNL